MDQVAHGKEDQDHQPCRTYKRKTLELTQLERLCQKKPVVQRKRMQKLERCMMDERGDRTRGNACGAVERPKHRDLN